MDSKSKLPNTCSLIAHYANRGDTVNETFKVDLRICLDFEDKLYDISNAEFKKAVKKVNQQVGANGTRSDLILITDVINDEQRPLIVEFQKKLLSSS